MGAVPRTSPPLASTAAPRQETPVQAPTANDEPPAPGSSPQVIKDRLWQVSACYYYAYGLACPYEPSCLFKHEATRIPSGHYRGVANSNGTLTVLGVVADMNRRVQRHSPSLRGRPGAHTSLGELHTGSSNSYGLL